MSILNGYSLEVFNMRQECCKYSINKSMDDVMISYDNNGGPVYWVWVDFMAYHLGSIVKVSFRIDCRKLKVNMSYKVRSEVERSVRRVKRLYVERLMSAVYVQLTIDF